LRAKELESEVWIAKQSDMERRNMKIIANNPPALFIVSPP
jgi:hypothetical protein